MTRLFIKFLGALFLIAVVLPFFAAYFFLKATWLLIASFIPEEAPVQHEPRCAQWDDWFGACVLPASHTGPCQHSNGRTS